MLNYDEALGRILGRAACLSPERVPLAGAGGRVLAEDLFSPAPIPATDRSAMDGYAVRYQDVIGLSNPLPVVGECQTGHPTPSCAPGAACRIFTGATLPPGFDCVIMQEDADRQGDSVAFRERPRRWQHVRRRGEELAAGALALRAGTRLGPPQLGLAASLDCTELVVCRQPRMTVLCTGDELRPPGTVGAPHMIPDSNSVVLLELGRQCGALVMVGPRLIDDVTTAAAALRTAAECSDLVVTVGGASVGDHDVVRGALEAAGGEIDFWKVRIKPGKPLLFGRHGASAFLGLPGNPFSAWVTFSLFAMPLLRRMQGEVDVAPRRLQRRLLRDFTRKPGRRAYVLAEVREGGVLPLPDQSSGSVVALATAGTLMELTEDSTAVAAGTLVDTIDIGFV